MWWQNEKKNVRHSLFHALQAESKKKEERLKHDLKKKNSISMIKKPAGRCGGFERSHKHKSNIVH